MKFAVDPSTAQQLLTSKLLSRASAKTRSVISTYYDTHQHLLRKAGAAYRVRSQQGAFEQTIKIPSPGPLGMQNYEEVTTPLPGAVPNIRAFDRRLLSGLVRRPSALRLEPQFTTNVQRTTAIIRHKGTRFEVAVDVGTLTNHGSTFREQEICEVEFELIRGNPTVMLDRVLSLCNSFDLSPVYLTKAQRGYALARPSLRPTYQKASEVALTPEMSVGTAFRAIVGEALSHLHANHQPTLDGEPNAVHQSRVAIRRIRAALRAFKRNLPYDKRKAFNGEFRWLQQRFAPARDWHVFMEETLPRIALASPDAQAEIARLRPHALTERRRTMAEAAEVLQGRRYTRLILEFQRWLLELEQEQPQLFEMPLKPFARSVLSRTRRDFLADARPLSRLNPDELHELRKLGKKCRYATEFFAPLWSEPGIAVYLKTLEKLQEQFGAAVDAFVARHLLALVPPRALDLWQVQTVGEWSEQRVRASIKAGQPTWRKFQHLRPFWDSPGIVAATRGTAVDIPAGDAPPGAIGRPEEPSDPAEERDSLREAV